MKTYAERDRQWGKIVTVSGIDVYQSFNADLKEYTVEPGTLTVDYQQRIGKSGLLLFGSESTPKLLTLAFYVGGEDEDEAQINAERLIQSCSRECVIRIGTSRFEYAALLSGAPTVEDTGVQSYLLVTLVLYAVRRLPLVSVDFAGKTLQLDNPGAVASGLCITLTPTKKITSMQVGDVTVKNLAANVPFVIDGLSGTVTADGENRFADTDLTQFPQIQPGENEISLSQAVPTTLEYYPTF